MIKYNRNLQKILAFGTDGEKALSDAFTTVLPFATHLLCDIHLRDNCKSKLSQLNIPTQTSNQFLEDIFGQIHGSEKQKGLVDAMTNEEFESKLKNIKDTWPKRHINGAAFRDYFCKEKVPLIRRHMTADIRSMAGLGYPPISYNQNANEAPNSAFKRGMGHKLSLPQAVKRIQAFLKNQHDQITLALMNSGEYRVSEQYKDLLVDGTKFFRMSQQGKKDLRRKFTTEKLKPRESLQPLDDLHEEDLVQLGEDNTRDSAEAATSSGQLSLSVPLASWTITTIPSAILLQIKHAAEFILNSNNSIVQSPGSDRNLFMVLSKTNAKLPHMVTRVEHQPHVQFT